MLHSEQRRSGNNLAPNGAFVAFLKAGQEACQDHELLPADTAGVRVTIGSFGKPSPTVHLTLIGMRGEVITAGGLTAGWREGVVTIPVRHVAMAREGVRLCLRSDGPQQIALAGQVPYPGHHMEAAGSSMEGSLRYDYMRPGRESWLSLLPTLAHRSTIGRSDLVRHWAWAAAIVLMILAGAVALATVVREEPS